MPLTHPPTPYRITAKQSRSPRGRPALRDYTIWAYSVQEAHDRLVVRLREAGIVRVEVVTLKPANPSDFHYGTECWESVGWKVMTRDGTVYIFDPNTAADDKSAVYAATIGGGFWMRAVDLRQMMESTFGELPPRVTASLRQALLDCYCHPGMRCDFCSGLRAG